MQVYAAAAADYAAAAHPACVPFQLLGLLSLFLVQHAPPQSASSGLHPPEAAAAAAISAKQQLLKFQGCKPLLSCCYRICSCTCM